MGESVTIPAERLAQVRSRPHISFSEWSLFRAGCQWRWYLDYIEGHRMNDQSLALEFGTAMHATIEELLDPDPIKRLGLDECVLRFRVRLFDAAERLTNSRDLPYGPFHELRDAGEHPFEQMDAGERILRELMTVPDIASGRVVKVEYRIFDDLERTDEPIKFKGFIDMILSVTNGRGQSTMVVLDFKTCKWGWSYKKQTDPMVLAQVRLYKHFICKKTQVNPKLVQTKYLLLKKRPRPNDPATETLKVASSENDVRTTVSSLQTDVTRMRAGVYERNRDSCIMPWGVCPHYDTERCPGKLANKGR